jgi:hypothetical protein
MRKRTAPADAERFQIGDWYLDRPYAEGIWHACRYHKRTRSTRRRSLGTRDKEAAKIALAALVAAAPRAKDRPRLALIKS